MWRRIRFRPGVFTISGNSSGNAATRLGLTHRFTDGFTLNIPAGLPLRLKGSGPASPAALVPVLLWA